jgi:hypothetical protein
MADCLHEKIFNKVFSGNRVVGVCTTCGKRRVRTEGMWSDWKDPEADNFSCHFCVFHIFERYDYMCEIGSKVFELRSSKNSSDVCAPYQFDSNGKVVVDGQESWKRYPCHLFLSSNLFDSNEVKCPHEVYYDEYFPGSPLVQTQVCCTCGMRRSFIGIADSEWKRAENPKTPCLSCKFYKPIQDLQDSCSIEAKAFKLRNEMRDSDKHSSEEEIGTAYPCPFFLSMRRETMEVGDSNHSHPMPKRGEKSDYDQGIKFDEGKQNWYAMPLEILEPLAEVFRAGEKKYETFNCLKPFDDPARRFYDAMMRHVEAQQIDPLAKDPDTGCYHAAQIAFNALLRLYNCRKLQEKENENAARKE